MLKVFGREKITPVDRQIDVVLQKMQEMDPLDEEYPALIGHLERLYKLKDKGSPPRVSRDTMAVVLGNLFGIFLIVVYEQKHVMTSKGFSQLIRPRNQ